MERKLIAFFSAMQPFMFSGTNPGSRMVLSRWFIIQDAPISFRQPGCYNNFPTANKTRAGYSSGNAYDNNR